MLVYVLATRRWENGFEIEELALGPANGKLAKAGKKVTVSPHKSLFTSGPSPGL